MSRIGSFGRGVNGLTGLSGFWSFAEKHPIICLFMVGTVASEVGAVIRTAIGGGSKSLSIDIPGIGGVGGTLSGSSDRAKTQKQIDDIVERLCELERLHDLNKDPIDVEAKDFEVVEDISGSSGLDSGSGGSEKGD